MCMKAEPLPKQVERAKTLIADLIQAQAELEAAESEPIPEPFSDEEAIDMLAAGKDLAQVERKLNSPPNDKQAQIKELSKRCELLANAVLRLLPEVQEYCERRRNNIIESVERRSETIREAIVKELDSLFTYHDERDIWRHKKWNLIERKEAYETPYIRCQSARGKVHFFEVLKQNWMPVCTTIDEPSFKRQRMHEEFSERGISKDCSWNAILELL